MIVLKRFRIVTYCCAVSFSIKSLSIWYRQQNTIYSCGCRRGWKSHFRKIHWLPVSDRVEYCIANTVFNYWNGIVPGYIHEMFKHSLCRYSTRSQMTLDIPLRKTNTGQKSLFFLGPKIWSKIGPSINNVRTSSFFIHAIKKNILLHLQN